jgi:hypothetical protein
MIARRSPFVPLKTTQMILVTTFSGKKLDLSFLKDIYVNIEGELKYTNDIKYWQANNFYYPFQKSITFTVWGGK